MRSLASRITNGRPRLRQVVPDREARPGPPPMITVSNALGFRRSSSVLLLLALSSWTPTLGSGAARRHRPNQPNLAKSGVVN